MSGRSVPSQLDQVLPRFSVQKPGPYHPFGRIRIAPFGKGVLRILGESAYTNSEGKKASIVSASSIDSASAGIWASVSNRYPHLVQDQRLRTTRSLTYSDHSVTNSA